MRSGRQILVWVRHLIKQFSSFEILQRLSGNVQATRDNLLLNSPTFQTHNNLTLSLLMLHICGVSKTFSEWYQKTNKTEDINKLTLLAFKIIIILHNTGWQRL
jgi:hypothetical protein